MADEDGGSDTGVGIGETMMWRPIETAPRNGQRILLRRIMDPWKVVGYGYWASEKGIDGWIAFGLTEPPGNLGLAAPDGWMPIPSGDDVIDPTTPLLARMAEALKAMQMEARARNCGLKIADDVLAEYAAMRGENGDG